MTVTLEIDDQLIPAIEQFLATQRVVKLDEVTGASLVVPIYTGPEELIEKTVGSLLATIAQQYPPPHIREKLAARKTIEDEIKELTRPRRK